MINLKAKYDYVLRIETKIVTKTSKNLQPLEMVFDTGAGTTSISEQLALDYGYKIKEGYDYVDGIGGRVKAKYAIIPDLIIGDINLGPVYVHVIKFHEELAQRTSALLGLNVLSWFKMFTDCIWDDNLSRFMTANIGLEPKFDINDLTPLDSFSPFSREQRFGSSFIADSNIN
ncbi:MAG: retroviral-like aspartic protease family protein [Oscillospiraceae bacterium]|nr:retroviral-like aspartic protease family protein [Oscillospiraceae bacterium]